MFEDERLLRDSTWTSFLGRPGSSDPLFLSSSFYGSTNSVLEFLSKLVKKLAQKREKRIKIPTLVDAFGGRKWFYIVCIFTFENSGDLKVHGCWMHRFSLYFSSVVFASTRRFRLLSSILFFLFCLMSASLYFPPYYFMEFRSRLVTVRASHLNRPVIVKKHSEKCRSHKTCYLINIRHGIRSPLYPFEKYNKYPH